ncbi:hypothetical protein V8C44DRAFT_295088 [Trichoderma aethiopicum]
MYLSVSWSHTLVLNGILPRGSRPVEHGGCVGLIAAAFVSVTMAGYCLDVRETIKRSRPALSVAASLPFTSPPPPLAYPLPAFERCSFAVSVA